MLKAIGKSITVRISSLESAKMPIIQGFWSLNSAPIDNNGENVKATKKKGFLRFDSHTDFKTRLLALLKEEMMFFAGMKPKKKLGKLIEIANKEDTYKKKGEKFLNLLREANDR